MCEVISFSLSAGTLFPVPHRPIILTPRTSQMTSIPFANPQLSLSSVGRLDHEYLIPQNVKKMKEASSILYDFNNRLELEQKVRPVTAAQL